MATPPSALAGNSTGLGPGGWLVDVADKIVQLGSAQGMGCAHGGAPLWVGVETEAGVFVHHGRRTLMRTHSHCNPLARVYEHQTAERGGHARAVLPQKEGRAGGMNQDGRRRAGQPEGRHPGAVAPTGGVKALTSPRPTDPLCSLLPCQDRLPNSLESEPARFEPVSQYVTSLDILA